MEVESFKAKQDEKKRALFAEIEKKLKGGIEQKNANSLSSDK